MSNVTAYEKMRRERDDALNQVAEERQKTFMAKKNFREEINKVNKKKTIYEKTYKIFSFFVH